MNLQQREIALVIERRSHQCRQGIAGAKVEAADLARRDVDVVWSGQVRLVRGAKEPEAVLQYLQNAFCIDGSAFAGMGLEDRKNDVLLARPGQALQAQLASLLQHFCRRKLLELAQLENMAEFFELPGGDRFLDREAADIVVLAVIIPTAPALGDVGVSGTGSARARASRVSGVISHSCSSSIRVICCFDCAPTTCISTWPFLNRISVGILRTL